MDEIECLTVVIHSIDDNPVIYKHFFCTKDVVNYLRLFPMFFYERIEIFADRQAPEKVKSFE